jgi:hypothetical protein
VSVVASACESSWFSIPFCLQLITLAPRRMMTASIDKVFVFFISIVFLLDCKNTHFILHDNFFEKKLANVTLASF